MHRLTSPRTAAVAICVLVTVAVALAHNPDPVYNYPVSVDDVTIHTHSRSVFCEEDGSQRIRIRQELTLNSERAAEQFEVPSISWREGSATAWLIDATVRRDGRTAFHLGPRPDGPALQLHPSGLDVGPIRTAELPLPDLQGGDRLEWEIELQREPLIEGQVFAQMNWTLRHPVESARFSVEVPRGMDLQSRTWGPIGEPLVVPEGDRETWLWRAEGPLEPVDPRHGDVLPQTIVSSADSWETVGTWLRERIVSAGGELGDESGALTDAITDLPHSSRIDQVFDHVRATLELPHVTPWHDPFTPRTPAEVLDSGVGDCKDRAWLIYRALEEAELIPYLAVTGLAEGSPSLAEQPPTPLLLDHVLVGVSGPGRTVWLDPTGAAEVRMDTGYALDALVLGPDRQPLVTIDRLHRPNG
jgi:hypothetical protein